MKSISAFWALLVGLLSVIAQIVTYYLRFGRLNTIATLTEYLFFFLAGSLGGVILIFFLNRQTAERGRRMVLGAFLLASLVALPAMLVGGLLGPLGVLILPQILWALFAWLGSLLGRVLSRAET